MEQVRNVIGLNSFQLKWIAIVTMTADHVGAVLFPSELLFRYIGRISFPIFCFLLVEGFYHTRDVVRYMTRLGIFAFLSEIPYDLAFHGKLLEFQGQNVFFTLFLGIILMYLLKWCSSWPEKAVAALVIMWISDILRTDYSYKGILLVLVFCVMREAYLLKLVLGALWNFLWNNFVQNFGALAMIPIALYNGEPGRKMKYFFYLFYPLHLLVLYGISRWVL